MYAITAVAGKVSGVPARELVATGQPVRAVVRDATQTEAWAERGWEIATDFIEDPSSLARVRRRDGRFHPAAFEIRSRGRVS